MKKFCRVMILVLAVLSTAYPADTLSGVVIDSLNGTPLGKVKITLTSGSLTDTIYTDSLGRFAYASVSTAKNFLAPEGNNGLLLRQKNGLFRWQGGKGRVAVEVLDIRGRKIFQGVQSGTGGEFSLSSLGSGQYFIIINREYYYKYLRAADEGFLLSLRGGDLPIAGMARKTATQSYQAMFEMIPYIPKVMTLAANQTGLQIKMQGVPYRIYGMDLSPYQNGQDPNTGIILSESQIVNRMRIIAPYTRSIRSFSTTHGLQACGRVAHQFGLIAFICAWIGPDTSANNLEMDSLIAMAKRGEVDTAIVGSEVLLRGDIPKANLMQLINRFRQAVPNVPVTTADVYGEIDSTVAANCDFLYANFYPYWEGTDVNYAIASLHNEYKGLVRLAGKKEVIVSETGWPSAGDSMAEAAPSPGNAAHHFLNFISWARAEKVKYHYFEAYDELWKTSEGAVGAHWGIFDTAGVMKPGMDSVFQGDTIPDNWSGEALVDGPGTPAIVFTYVPPVGSFNNLRGKAEHIIPDSFAIVTYIDVAGGWWIKPTYAEPKTHINPDGSWVCDVTTGGIDEQATEFKVFLVPAGYVPPNAIASIDMGVVAAVRDTVRS